jgi:DNA polymerase elongation subunit (family B)
MVFTTDSNYIHFPHLKNAPASEAWDYAEMVAREVSSLFPKPIKLEFEDAIFKDFFILTKKRYMYRGESRDGVVDKKIGKKGVLLSRRDSSIFVRNLYEAVVTKIIDKENRDEILYHIIQEFNRLCSNSVPYKDFVVTKSVGNTGALSECDDRCRINGELILETYFDEKGKEKVKIGDYKVPKLPKDPKEIEKQMKLKDARTLKEYYERCLPAQVQLAEKMKRRGQLVQSGTRLEFLVTDIENHTAKQYEKLESMEYFLNHSSVLTIDFFYYIKIAINSIDEILNIAFGKPNPNEKYPFKKDFILSQYNFRYKHRRKVLEQLKEKFRPRIVIT